MLSVSERKGKEEGRREEGGRKKGRKKGKRERGEREEGEREELKGMSRADDKCYYYCTCMSKVKSPLHVQYMYNNIHCTFSQIKLSFMYM